MGQHKFRQRRGVLSIILPVILPVICISLVLPISSCKSLNAPSNTSPVYRVGLILSLDTLDNAVYGFQAGMIDFGYVEGQTIHYDVQRANGDRARMRSIAEQFVADEVDLIFATTTAATQEAQAATTEQKIPIVFTIVSDPIGSGVIASFREPGDNVTGVTRLLAGLIGKHILFLHEMMPTLNGIWMPYQAEYPSVELALGAAGEAVDLLDIALVETPIDSHAALVAEIERLSHVDELGFNAIKISPDPLMQSKESLATLMAFAQTHNLPLIANTPEQVREGALLTYADDIFESGHIAAALAHQILDGVDPATLSVDFVDPHLYINYQTAQTLGLAVDEGLLAQAREIIR
ncbi:MAG: ABC transporter substrate-binding protein [Chloroflexota bacterium]